MSKTKTWRMRLRALKNSILPVLVSFAAKLGLWLLLSSCRIRIVSRCDFTELSKSRCVLLLWHNRLALVQHFLWHTASPNCYSAVVSASRDGRLLSSLTATSPYARVIEVPAKQRQKALREMISALQANEVLMVTPDGPRGPRYEVKPGALYAARETQAPIVPFSYSASRYWQLRSWDQMMIPKPFSTITVGVGPALAAPQAGEAVEPLLASYSEHLCNWDKELEGRNSPQKEIYHRAHREHRG